MGVWQHVHTFLCEIWSFCMHISLSLNLSMVCDTVTYSSFADSSWILEGFNAFCTSMAPLLSALLPPQSMVSYLADKRVGSILCHIWGYQQLVYIIWRVRGRKSAVAHMCVCVHEVFLFHDLKEIRSSASVHVGCLCLPLWENHTVTGRRGRRSVLGCHTTVTFFLFAFLHYLLGS